MFIQLQERISNICGNIVNIINSVASDYIADYRTQSEAPNVIFIQRLDRELKSVNDKRQEKFLKYRPDEWTTTNNFSKTNK